MDKRELRDKIIEEQADLKYIYEDYVSYEQVLLAEDVLKLIDQLDEPETLSQEWIKDNQLIWPSAHGIDYYVPANKLYTLIMPKLGEPEKVVVPEFVAEWIEKYKPMDSLRVAFIYIHELPREDTFKIWIENGMSETFARAWLDGYTVEEKTYRVKLPDNESKSTTNILALRRTQDGRIVINQVSKTAFTENENSFLTEDEIKRNHEYLWGFAEEVESE